MAINFTPAAQKVFRYPLDGADGDPCTGRLPTVGPSDTTCGCDANGVPPGKFRELDSGCVDYCAQAWRRDSTAICQANIVAINTALVIYETSLVTIAATARTCAIAADVAHPDHTTGAYRTAIKACFTTAEASRVTAKATYDASVATALTTYTTSTAALAATYTLCLNDCCFNLCP